MNIRSAAKLVYTAGMGLLGKGVGRFFGQFLSGTFSKKIVELVCSITGIYVGVIISNDLEEMVGNAIDIVSEHHKEEVRVNP